MGRTALPATGQDADTIVSTLEAKRGRDARWQDGRTFGMVYDGGHSLHEVTERVATMFLHENALNTAAFPSLGEIQSEVVSITAGLLNAPADAAGFMTSGGTESILMAVKAARERGRLERGIEDPEMVVAESAHAAFHKAAHYFGIRLHKAPVRPDWRADVDAMAGLVNERTVLVAGSAPQYPQGVIDPIPELAALAATVDANFHVDACMGGFVLPFAERLGRAVPPWDFRVEGVTSMSADLHKLGYAPKGASVVLHRTRELRRYQTFVFDGWLGGFYGSPAMQGTRPALPMACAWATLHHLGLDGYLRLTDLALQTADRMRAGVAAVDGLRVLGEPDAHLVAVASAVGWEDRLDMAAVGDALLGRGWYLDRQGPPPSLHATVSAGNAAAIDAFLQDLPVAVDAVLAGATSGTEMPYATLE